jgi:hypothetical protein
MVYIHMKRAKVVPDVVHVRRKRRQAQLQAEADLIPAPPAALEVGEVISSPHMAEAEHSRSVIHAPKPSRVRTQGQSRSIEVVFVPQSPHHRYPPHAAQ